MSVDGNFGEIGEVCGIYSDLRAPYKETHYNLMQTENRNSKFTAGYRLKVLGRQFGYASFCRLEVYKSLSETGGRNKSKYLDLSH